MPRRIIDISIPLEADVASDPPLALPKIQYMRHDQTFERIASFFPGLQKSDLPDGAGWALEKAEITTHNGTHLDAPYHFHPTMDHALGAPKPAATIDQIPLEWCFQPGVKLDFRHFPDGYVATAKDVETELKRIGHALKPLEIVVVNTSAGAKYGKPDYVDSGCGMGREATLYLTERGVRVTGIDGWSWDAPFSFTAKRYAQGPRPEDHLGRPQGRPRHRLLPSGKAAQPRSAAAVRIHRRVLSGEGERRLRRLDTGRRHPRQLSEIIREDELTTYPRDRFSYSSPFTRPRLKLPGKGRMIVWSVVNIEEWEITRPMARQLSIAPQGQSAIPDMPNWTWYEYGMRVGFWRLMRALKKAKVTPTMSLNARVCETYPEATAAARDAGWEFMAHSYVQMPIQQIADKQAEIMQQSIDILQKFTGKFPYGWLGPGRGQMFDTLDYVAKAGFTWFGDWVLDDQPIWVKTAHGPVLAIPYSAEINDITMMVSHHHESDVLFNRTKDAFDRLYLESKESTRILAIGVHPYVTGQAHRIKYFEQLYAYINKHPGVVHWTGQQIHDWYAKQVPKPKE